MRKRKRKRKSARDSRLRFQFILTMRLVHGSGNDLRVWLSQYAFAHCPACVDGQDIGYAQQSGKYGIISTITLI